MHLTVVWKKRLLNQLAKQMPKSNVRFLDVLDLAAGDFDHHVSKLTHLPT